MPLLRVLCAFIFPLATPVICLAHTAVVILRTSIHIVVGADSKSAIYSTVNAAEAPTCKIMESNGNYFASAGFALDAKFDSDRMAARFLKQAGTLEQRAQCFAAAATMPFLGAVRRMHRLLPHEYSSYKGNGTMLTVGFVGIEGGVPKVVIVFFKVIDDHEGNPAAVVPTIKQCPGSLCLPDNPKPFFAFGQFDAIQKVTETTRFFTGDDAADVRRLIALEIADQPRTVGPPIDVLVIDSSGAHWMSPQGSCKNGLLKY